ncbi:hypothetical protein [Rivibacter subsaxonicus]|uniref:Uncharacterized protein n=1 Tax=Rivibacter subsaxonicus TaxID=457575 RepID=A0A4Q7VVY5_9BURK|nr:hypothetical protein [Rivibacter subsaxonicus]RZU00847.1 hypothetical protein EV670_1560 [Rivibacter subsaxonicus]
MTAAEILQTDYKLKTDYLVAHLARMWTRFGFFLTIQSALFGYSLQLANAEYLRLLAGFGLILALLWWHFAATDNYLVTVYRAQVAQVFHLMRAARAAAFVEAGLPPDPPGYSYVGSTASEAFDARSGEVRPVARGLLQWRSERLSATELGVVFALFFVALWLLRLVT